MCPDRMYLSAFYDDELNAADSSRIKEHVEGCPVCRAVMGEFSALSAGLIFTPLDDPVEIKQRSFDHIINRFYIGRTRRFFRRSVRIPSSIIAAAATIIIALGGGLLYTNFRRSPEPPTDGLSRAPEINTANPTFQDLIRFLEGEEGAQSQVTFQLPPDMNLQRISEPQLIRATEYPRVDE